jgi:hypothetical protein
MRLFYLLAKRGTMFNAYVLDWTMNDYSALKAALDAAGIALQPEGEHIRLSIPFERLREITQLLQAHLNARYNYVDIQFPQLNTTVIVFQQRIFTIRSATENAEAQQWAIAQGLPPAQADWGTSY